MQNKVIWITGASSGIGAAIAKKCNALGATVILSARREDELNKTLNELTHPENAFVLPLDLQQIDTFHNKAEQVIEKGIKKGETFSYFDKK